MPRISQIFNSKINIYIVIGYIVVLALAILAWHALMSDVAVADVVMRSWAWLTVTLTVTLTGPF